ncbi:invasion associated locus B family protein [Rhizobium sp. AB2/73]|nr:invasion associated locus B family protein [Rhizobium sp. AB2/73]
MIQALKSGDKLELHATSKRGTATRYSYSLSGITAALKRISACN